MPNESMNRDLVTCARFPALVTAFTLTSHWLLVTFPLDLIGRGDLFCFVSMTHLSFFFSYFYFRLSICSRTIHRLIRQAGKIQSTIKFCTVGWQWKLFIAVRFYRYTAHALV